MQQAETPVAIMTPPAIRKGSASQHPAKSLQTGIGGHVAQGVGSDHVNARADKHTDNEAVTNNAVELILDGIFDAKEFNGLAGML
jgi:hypothetical protein